MNLRRESIYASFQRGPRFPDLLGVPPGVARNDDQKLHSIHRPEARMRGGQAIKVVAAIFGELNAARASGVELLQRLRQRREAAGG